MKYLSRSLLAMSLLLTYSPAYAEFTTPSETLVVAVENATVSGALYQAQRQAVSRVVSAYLRSKTPVPLTNPQLILDELWPRINTFFESQKILEQKLNPANSLMASKVVYKIKTRELTQAVDALLAIWQSQKSHHRISIIMDEDIVGHARQESSLRLELENTLLKQGYSIIDAEYNNKLITVQRIQFSDIFKDPAKAAELAQEQGADIVMIVSNEIKVDKLQSGLTQASAHVVIKSILASTGHKRLNLEEYLVAQDAQSNRAISKVGKMSGIELGSRLVDDLMSLMANESKPVEEASTHSLRVVLGGLNSYRSQAIPLLKALEEIPLIKSIELKSQGGGQSTFYVVYEGTQTALEKEIWERIETQVALSRLDREAAAESTIYLAFTPPVNLILASISNFPKQALPFIDTLKTIPGVIEVETRSFDGKDLALDVHYDGLNLDLERDLWAALEKHPEFNNLLREPSNSNQIKFKLGFSPLK